MRNTSRLTTAANSRYSRALSHQRLRAAGESGTNVNAKAAGNITATGVAFSFEATAHPREIPKAMLSQKYGCCMKSAASLEKPGRPAGGYSSEAPVSEPASCPSVTGQ